MPVVEKYGLSILFGLCLLIVGVGLFAEDPAVEAARKKISDTGPQPRVEPASTSGGTDWWPDDRMASHQPGVRKLKAYEPGQELGPDPDRDRSLDIGRRPAPAPQPEAEPVEPRPEPDAAGVRMHTVVAGDSYGELAKRYLGSADRWREIAAANPGIPPEALPRGKQLRIPAGAGATPAPADLRLVTVRKGDCLSKIAKRILGDASRYPEIARLNDIPVDAVLQAGTQLKVPSRP